MAKKVRPFSIRFAKPWFPSVDTELTTRTSTDTAPDEGALGSRRSSGSDSGSLKGRIHSSFEGREFSFVGSTQRRDVWQSVFNPGRNYNPNNEKVGRSYYDHVDDPKAQPTTWDYILKAENVRKVTEFDVNNDGFVTADEVRSALGTSVTIEDMIRKTDKFGDGRVAYKEFFELIREN